MTRQQLQILDHIEKHGSITNFEATVNLRMCDFRKRISELRALGVNIVDIWEDHEDGRHKRYFMGGVNNG